MTANPRSNPYVGPRAFETGEKLYGRTVETERLFNLLLAERIVLFYSPSGAGKTSLLQAALIPRLRDEGFRVSPPLRVNEPLPAGVTGNRYIYSVLRALEENRPAAERLAPAALASLTLGDYLAQREAAASAEEPAGEVLLFDQFEEALTVNPTDQEDKTAFFAQVGAALRERHRWALFALREDYLAALEPYLRVIPTRGKATFRLDLLGEAAARAALQEPARAVGVTFDDDAAQQVVDDLRRVQVQQLDGTTALALGPAVEPVQLQVVAYRLWESLPPDAAHIGEDALVGLGDVNRALRDYYAQSVARVAAETGVRERAIREWVARQLITEQGRRDLVARGPESSGGLSNTAIARLESAHLIRAEQRAGTTWYELAHDRLVEPLQTDNAEWFATHLSLLQRQAALWDDGNRDAGLLLSGDALAEAEAWAKSHAGELTATERDFMAGCRAAQAQVEREQRQTRRIRWLAVGATVLMILALVAAGFALAQTRKTEIAQITAEARRLEAEDAKTTAEARRIEAEDARATAEARRLEAKDAQATAETRRVEAENAKATAVAEQTRAERQAQIALARQLAAQAQTLRTESSVGWLRHLLLAVESIRLHPDMETFQLLRPAVGLFAQQILSAPLMGGVQVVAFSPYSAYIAAGDAEGYVRVWSTVNHKEVAGLRHIGEVFQILFSPDEQRLYSAGRDNVVRILDIPLNVESATLVYTATLKEMALDAAGQRLVTASGGQVRMWDTVALRVIWERSYKFTTVDAIAFSPDGQRIAAGLSGNTTIELLDAWTGVDINTLQATWVQDVAFNATGEKIVAANMGDGWGNLTVYDVESGKRLLEWSNMCTQVAFNPVKDWVLADDPIGVRVMDATTGDLKVRKIHTGDPVRVFAFSADGLWAATGGKDGIVNVWDTNTGQNIAWAMHPTAVQTVAFSPNGRWLGVGDVEGHIVLWDIVPREVWSHLDVGGTIKEIVVDPDGQWLAVVAFAGAGVKFLDLATMEVTDLALDNPSDILYMNSNGQLLILERSDKTTLWQFAIREPIGDFTCSIGELKRLAYSMDGHFLVATRQQESERLLEVWHLDTCEKIAPLSSPTTAVENTILRDVNLAAFNADGTQIALSTGITLSVWDAAITKELYRMQPFPWPEYCFVDEIMFSRDGHQLFAVGECGLGAWDVATGALVFQHTSEETKQKPISPLAYSNDGKWLAVQLGDYFGNLYGILVWDTQSWQVVAQLQTTDRISAITFSCDNDWIFTGNSDGVDIWLGPGADLVAEICQRLPRNLTREEWRQYLGDEPYRATCPNLPEGK